MTLTNEEVGKLKGVLKSLQDQRERWCSQEVVDDAEEMWSEIPEMLDKIVPVMESIFGTSSTKEDNELEQLRERVVTLEKELKVQKTIGAAAIMAVGERLDTDQAFAEKADRTGLLGESLELLEDMEDGMGNVGGPLWQGYRRRVQECLKKAKEKGFIK